MQGNEALEGRPPAEVVAAFGGRGPLERLPGGQGRTWRAGPVVLRPAEGRGETEWASQVLSLLGRSGEFSIPDPVRDDADAWTRDGWHALAWVPGVADESRVEEVLRAGAAFHRALAEVPKPGFLAARAHPWAVADRIAWREAPAPDGPLLPELFEGYEVVDEPCQLIHGDLLGNVLFAEGRAPAIIDWAPYWRPAGYGMAIAAVDAACWHAYPLARLADDHGLPAWRQFLLRALVFRIATLQLLGRWTAQLTDRHAPVVHAVLALR